MHILLNSLSVMLLSIIQRITSDYLITHHTTKEMGCSTNPTQAFMHFFPISFYSYSFESDHYLEFRVKNSLAFLYHYIVFVDVIKPMLILSALGYPKENNTVFLCKGLFLCQILCFIGLFVWMPIVIIYSYLLLCRLPSRNRPQFIHFTYPCVLKTHCWMCFLEHMYISSEYKLIYRVFACSLLLDNSSVLAKMIVPVYTPTISM